MPLGLSKLIKAIRPKQPDSYDPNREAMFAQLLAGGQGQAQDPGTAIGNLAKTFFGSRGLRQQGQAKQEGLAKALAGAGINVDPAVLSAPPHIQAEIFRRSRPQAREKTTDVRGRKRYTDTGELLFPNVESPEVADPLKKEYAKPLELRHPETGQIEGAHTPADARRLYSQGYRAPQEEKDAQIKKSADGYLRYTSGPKEGQRVNPDVKRWEKGPRTQVNVNLPNLQKSTVGQLEKKVIMSRESLGRMDQIVSEFKPEYLTIGDKISTSLLGWKEKAGITLDPSQKKGLADRATFFQKTFDSVNRAIRDMTGAQMSEGEADRLMRGMPNQDDSPTEFMAKMQSVIGQIKSYDRLYRETIGQGLGPGPAGESAPTAGANQLESMSDDELMNIARSLGIE